MRLIIIAALVLSLLAFLVLACGFYCLKERPTEPPQKSNAVPRPLPYPVQALQETQGQRREVLVVPTLAEDSSDLPRKVGPPRVRVDPVTDHLNAALDDMEALETEINGRQPPQPIRLVISEDVIETPDAQLELVPDLSVGVESLRAVATSRVVPLCPCLFCSTVLLTAAITFATLLAII